MGGTATEMMLERPQEAIVPLSLSCRNLEDTSHYGCPQALFAEASRLLCCRLTKLFRSLFGSTVQSRVSGAVCGIVTEGEVSNVAQACRATACYS